MTDAVIAMMKDSARTRFKPEWLTDTTRFEFGLHDGEVWGMGVSLVIEGKEYGGIFHSTENPTREDVDVIITKLVPRIQRRIDKINGVLK